jgi:glycine/D-amino acid oxidase-like deaminating enzyme
MSGGLEMGRHVPAHGTEADKSDFHAGMLLQVGDAERIVDGCTSRRRLPTMAETGPQICVLGGGISGLTTAVVLRLLGYRVEVAAPDLIGAPAPVSGRPDPTFASQYPAASIIPRSVVIADEAWHIETSLRFYAALQFAATAGVRRQRHFELFETPVEVPPYAARLPAFAPVPSGLSSLAEGPRRVGAHGVSGWTFECFFAEMPEYGPWLRRSLAVLGGSVVGCRRLEHRDVQAIPADVVVNCTGYGSAALFDDGPNLALVKGVLVQAFVDRRDPAANRPPPFSYNYTPDRSVYPTASGGATDVYWYPRVDSWVLGGTRLSGRLDRSGRWRGEEPVGPTVDIDGIAVPAPIVQLNRELIQSATGVDIGPWPQTATVGYRCVRTAESGGVRLEAETQGDKLIVHNYGHGGAGVALAWSCAVRVAQIIAAERRPADRPPADDRSPLGWLAALARSAAGAP